MSTLVEQLSTYESALRFEALPRDVVHTAKRLTVEPVGCALGGHWSEPARIARDLAASAQRLAADTSTPAALAARSRAETETWAEVIEAAGMRIE